MCKGGSYISGPFSGERVIMPGAIFQWAILGGKSFLGDSFPRDNLPESNFPEGNFQNTHSKKHIHLKENEVVIHIHLYIYTYIIKKAGQRGGRGDG